MKSLDELFIECSTDKSSITHNYAKTYEQYFESWRDKEFVLLEIGVSAGGSMKAWRKYFPNANVYGIDLNPDCTGEGVFIGDQTDPDFLDKVLTVIGEPSLLIEDGSHYGPYTIKTFEYLFPKIANGGYMVIEDSHCMYDSTYGEAPPFGQGMSEVFKFFSGLACDVDLQGRGMTGNFDYAMKVENPNFAPIPKYSPILESMHIHQSLWLFKRR